MGKKKDSKERKNSVPSASAKGKSGPSTSTTSGKKDSRRKSTPTSLTLGGKQEVNDDLDTSPEEVEVSGLETHENMTNEEKDSKSTENTQKVKKSPKKVDHVDPAEAEKIGAETSGFFGVKSYLHHFYEKPEDDFLIHPKARGCGALWYKIGLSIGSTLFLLGAIAIIIGYAIPKQNPIKGRNEEFVILDKNAERFNRNLDICKLIGLAGFCSGGLVLVISLLAPTFSASYWDDPAGEITESFRVFMGPEPEIEAGAPHSPIPVTEKIKCIQPPWIN